MPTPSENINSVVIKVSTSETQVSEAKALLQTVYQQAKPQTSISYQLAYIHERLLDSTNALADANKILANVEINKGDFYEQPSV